VPDGKKSKSYTITVGSDGRVKKDFDCIPTGAQQLCFSVPYKYAKLTVNYGFTITSTNPVFLGTGGGTACWNINVNQIVEYGLAGSNNNINWTIITGGSCIKACGQPEECQ
jgi:hypothetical protein